MSETAGIVVAGCGLVTPWGAGNADMLAVAKPHASDAGGPFAAVPDAMRDRYADPAAELKRDKGGWMTAGAMQDALVDAGLVIGDHDPQRVGLALGSAFAGQLGMIAFAEEVRAQTARFVSPINFPKTVGNYVAGAMARAFKFTGPNVTVASGAASGLAAVAAACGVLADGVADVMFAGGYDVLSDELVRGLPEDPTYAEGACVYVLMRRGDFSGRSGRGVIDAWSSEGQQGGRVSAVDVVGNSFAAESAARLAYVLSALTTNQPMTVSASDQGATTQLAVSRMAD